jgi:hypothetical protein
LAQHRNTVLLSQCGEESSPRSFNYEELHIVELRQILSVPQRFGAGELHIIAIQFRMDLTKRVWVPVSDRETISAWIHQKPDHAGGVGQGPSATDNASFEYSLNI